MSIFVLSILICLYLDPIPSERSRVNKIKKHDVIWFFIFPNKKKNKKLNITKFPDAQDNNYFDQNRLNNHGVVT